jgi:hypothetical protein
MTATKSKRPIASQAIKHAIVLSIPEVLTFTANVRAIEPNHIQQLCECRVHMPNV